MSFRVHKLTLDGFRNIEWLEVLPSPDVSIIVGPNARGKTNTLEALQLLTRGSSFRNPSWQELVMWGRDSAKISIEATEGDRRRSVTMGFTSSGRRSIEVNGKIRKSAADVIGVVPSVLFTPEALRMVKDSPKERRDVVDSVGSQLSSTYAQLKADYDKVVRQRNRLLRNGITDSQAREVWDERLITLGSRLSEHRRRLLGRIERHAVYIHESLSQQKLSMRYVPSWEKDGVDTGDGDEDDTIAALALDLTQVERLFFRLDAPLVVLLQHDVDFVFDLRDALLQLRIAQRLALHARQAFFQILNRFVQPGDQSVLLRQLIG